MEATSDPGDEIEQRIRTSLRVVVMTPCWAAYSSRDGRPRFRAYGRRHIDRMRHLDKLSSDQLVALKVASAVLPFRVNDYVLDELIDWDNIPSDPIYQMTFPQAGMLADADFLHLKKLVLSGVDTGVIRQCVRDIQTRMNPHPGGQMELNVPTLGGAKLYGCQHKYRETVLYFPAAGQTCHAYCTYCFRWPQFVGIEHFKIAMRDPELLVSYLREHREVTDVLVTGGDPLVMSSEMLRKSIKPLLGRGLDHITSIRIGTRALTYWPYRFITDRDADDLLHLFEDILHSGRRLALMAHFTHPRELRTVAAREALRRVRCTGAVVRCQAPLVRHVNDDPAVWADLWREQVRLGAVPYYMFVARDTGPRAYFEMTLADGLRVYSEAISRVSGLGRTVRGPIMSAVPGKILIDGIVSINGQKVFVLKMIQGRDPSWTNRMFFARFDPQATWFDQLKPAFDGRDFFFNSSLQTANMGGWKTDSVDNPDSVQHTNYGQIRCIHRRAGMTQAVRTLASPSASGPIFLGPSRTTDDESPGSCRSLAQNENPRTTSRIDSGMTSGSACRSENPMSMIQPRIWLE